VVDSGSIEDSQTNLSRIELLAAVEHERWSHWQRFVHEQCRLDRDGSLVIPPELARKWERQFSTPYDSLTEEEKESDREQVRRYLPMIDRTLDAS
jgi:hypothetical protein